METENSTNEELIAKAGGRQMIAQDSGTNSTPPARPSDGEMPEEFDGEMPSMPGEMDCEDEEESCAAPNMPGSMQGGPMEGMFPGEITATVASSDSVLHPVAYLSLGAGSVILSLVIMYACFSNFFHKKPGETFNTRKKFILYIVAAVILTVGLVALCYFIPTWIA